MDGSRRATCCVCYNSSNGFHENILLLQTKHSNKSISAILTLILGSESTCDWLACDPICFECVNKINDYDESFEKMQLIEREFKRIQQNNSNKIKANNFASIAANDGDVEFHDDRFGVDDDDSDLKSDDTNEPVFNGFQLVNFDETSHTNDPGVEQKSIDADKLCSETIKSEFYCEECGKNLQSSKGLTVRWCFDDVISLSLNFRLSDMQIHMTRMHKDAIRFECSDCHEFFPNKLLLEVRSSLSNGDESND